MSLRQGRHTARFGIILGALLIAAQSVSPADQGKKPSPTPRQMWRSVRSTLPPLDFTLESNELVQSDSEPDLRLRRIELLFTGQVAAGHSMGHRAVILMPADPRQNRTPERKGKVVVIAHGFGDDTICGNFAEPIAARTGYPTMDLLLPGDYDGEDGEGKWLRYFRNLSAQTGNPADHDFIRCAVAYLQALDIFSEILNEVDIQAIIGGHSKRAYYAYTAAAMDPERIAGVVFMGCERLYVRDEFPEAVKPFATQAHVQCPVFYLGATNEDGYEMFNINKIQARLKKPWQIEYIPNYRHASRSEKQFLDWQMWTSHLFDGRPVTRISDLSWSETETGTVFRARIDSPNKIIQVKVWYVYNDDIPLWRDLTWYPEIMKPLEGSIYEGYVDGKLPDAWLVEVKDIAHGFPGYLSSLPQDLTHLPTAERKSRGSRSRLWEPKIKKAP
jgi:hypothetical protein